MNAVRVGVHSCDCTDSVCVRARFRLRVHARASPERPSDVTHPGWQSVSPRGSDRWIIGGSRSRLLARWRDRKLGKLWALVELIATNMVALRF